MWQLRAMIEHDIGELAGEGPEMVIVVALRDQVVNPSPARELARGTAPHW